MSILATHQLGVTLGIVIIQGARGVRHTPAYLGLGFFLLSMLNACYRPPYNHFDSPRTLAETTALGAGGGAIVGAAAGNTILGTGIGAAGGAIVGMLKTSRAQLIKDMFANDIQLVEYGDRITLVVPTDRYFVFNRATLHELQFPGLEAMVNFIRLYPKANINVAGFTDNVDSPRINTLYSEARVHTMISFLFAHGIQARRLNPEAFGPLFPIGDNKLIHGSAYNRRLEIQWRVGGGCGHREALIMPPGIYK